MKIALWMSWTSLREQQSYLFDVLLDSSCMSLCSSERFGRQNERGNWEVDVFMLKAEASSDSEH